MISYADVLESYLIPAIESIKPEKVGIDGISGNIRALNVVTNSINDCSTKLSSDDTFSLKQHLESINRNSEICNDILSNEDSVKKNINKIKKVMTNVNITTMTNIKKVIDSNISDNKYKKAGINKSWFLNVSKKLIKVFDEINKLSK